MEGNDDQKSSCEEKNTERLLLRHCKSSFLFRGKTEQSRDRVEGKLVRYKTGPEIKN